MGQMRSLMTVAIAAVLCALLSAAGISGTVALPLATAVSSLSDRVAAFPDWTSKPSVESSAGSDLYYPGWMEGTWTATSTLMEAIAPLAPEIVSPGFEGNHHYLHRPMKFRVRFIPQTVRSLGRFPVLQPRSQPIPIIADRAFNGLEIAQAYLGDLVRSVRVSDNDPNEQVTHLKPNRQLRSIAIGRKSEQMPPDRFIATEIVRQVFRGESFYLNVVEATTDYRHLSDDTVAAEQLTAIYLAPEHPDYFRAAGRPVALYRYELELNRERLQPT
ncbi:hypothetical protein KR51_00005010 [Rubidibacter lacunae KORDI 51-2]|uniref:DUF6816 domain-containing protein n=1 Tax=Rubidibacter lacunae KORDI 51-2 TaxID=582515 RepID=U5DM80_9CHRO|nr:hypothetical protein [Rubidibacter lacunae]ERN42786.1 hypothetical protein KR51_00005010 [Rubidibacter lacunae KORDI 51-2]